MTRSHEWPDAFEGPEQAFHWFLQQRDLGRPVPLEELCARWPRWTAELEELGQAWDALERVQLRLGAAGTAEFLRGARPPSVVELLGAEESGETWLSDTTVESLRRLLEHSSRIQRYAVEGKIGEGGMGAVLDVWDEDLRRSLAMKVIKVRGIGADVDRRRYETLLNRFLQEAQVTAQLDHPGVVPVHELGLDAEGNVFFTMSKVRGKDLREVFEQSQADGWSQARVLGVLQRVCETMAYAHSRGVLHRDLKPANVMVGEFGEVYVMDWGLARVDGEGEEDPADPQRVGSDRGDEVASDPDSPLATRAAVGTLFYMPPEQVAGQRLGPQADVYAVGAMLYELLSGRMPYQKPGDDQRWEEVQAAIVAGPPAALEQVAKEVPPELVAICEKAMHRDLSERYADMTALGDELRAYQENRVVQAHRTGAVVEMRKWIARNRATAAALAVAVVLFVSGTAGIAAVEAKSNAKLEGKNVQLEEQNVQLDTKNRELANAYGEVAEQKAELVSTNQELEATNLQLEASHAESDFDRAAMAGRLGDWPEALEALEDAEAQGYDDDVGLALMRARGHTALMDREAARTALTELLEREDLGDRRGAVLLALCDSQLGDVEGGDEAYELLDQALEAGLSGIDLAYAQLLAAESTPEALERAEAVLGIDPFHQQALSMRATLLFLSGRFSECRTVSETYRLLFPRDPQGYVGVLFADGFGGDERRLEGSIERIRAEFGDELADDLGDLMNRLLAARAMMTLEAWIGHGGDTSTVGIYQLFVMANRARKLTKLGAIKAHGPNLRVLRNMFTDFRQANMKIFRNDLATALEHAEAAASTHPDGGLQLLVAHLAGTQRPSSGFDQAMQWVEDGIPLYERAFETPSIYLNVRQAAAYHLAYSHSLLVEGGREEEREAARAYIELLLAEDSLGPTVLSMLEMFAREYMADPVQQRRVLARWRHEHPDNVGMLTRYADLELAEGNLTAALELAEELTERSSVEAADSVTAKVEAAFDEVFERVAEQLGR